MTTRKSRRLGRPPDTSSAETRQRIIDVARARFANLGYQAATNKDIAETAGITTGAIYHYFGSKQALYLAVFDEVERHVFGRLRQVEQEETTFVSKISRVLLEAVEINREDPSIAAFFVDVPTESQRNPELATLTRQQGVDSLSFFSELVAGGRRTGEIAADVNERHLVFALMAITSGIAKLSTGLRDSAMHEAMTLVINRMIAGNLLSAKRATRARGAASGS